MIRPTPNEMQIQIDNLKLEISTRASSFFFYSVLIKYYWSLFQMYTCAYVDIMIQVKSYNIAKGSLNR